MTIIKIRFWSSAVWKTVSLPENQPLSQLMDRIAPKMGAPIDGYVLYFQNSESGCGDKVDLSATLHSLGIRNGCLFIFKRDDEGLSSFLE